MDGESNDKIEGPIQTKVLLSIKDNIIILIVKKGPV